MSEAGRLGGRGVHHGVHLWRSLCAWRDLGVVILRRGFGGEGSAHSLAAQVLAAHSRSFSPRKRGFQDDNVWIAWRIESCTSVSLRSSAPADCLLCRGKTSSTDRDLPCVRSCAARLRSARSSRSSRRARL